VGQALSEDFVGIATWLLNVALLWVAISIAAMGFTLICTVARPFARTRKKRGN
jgi:hypothetical protein